VLCFNSVITSLQAGKVHLAQEIDSKRKLMGGELSGLVLMQLSWRSLTFERCAGGLLGIAAN
jgi:hypothetical protein